MKMTPVKSSNIEAAGYDNDSGELIVEFKGGSKYFYPNVPEKLFQEFEKEFDGEDGRSAGKFFHREIRHLPCEKLED